jgi:multicomponent Na+:H+ antiporter subunit E
MARVIGLTALWVALWGDVSGANVLWGVILAVALGWSFPSDEVRTVRVRPLAAVRFIGRLFLSLAVSSLTVARAALLPSPARTATAVHDVPLRTRSPLVAAVVANSITLTPGTMTLSCDPDTLALRVHVLGSMTADELRAQIARLEELASAALGAVLPDVGAFREVAQ